MNNNAIKGTVADITIIAYCSLAVCKFLEKNNNNISTMNTIPKHKEKCFSIFVPSKVIVHAF